MSNRTAALTLVIINPTETGGGASIEHKFSTGGGSIGTAANDTWRLSPHRTGAVAGHAEVRYLDGGFCLIDRSGRTYINSSSQPVGRGRRARLNHGDTLTIGRYRMRAELNGEAAVNSGMEEDAGQHRQLVDVAEGSLLRSESGQALPDGREPLEGLHTPAGEPISEDPLAPWPNTQERQGMSESTEQSREAKDTSRQHISGAPLMRGMEAEIDFADSDEMRLFLEEAGQTLKATVEGLLA
ncbi:MAG: type VI secretion system-associated FHA domain protein, partial [Marinobacter vinifirmus]